MRNCENSPDGWEYLPRPVWRVGRAGCGAAAAAGQAKWRNGQACRPHRGLDSHRSGPRYAPAAIARASDSRTLSATPLVFTARPLTVAMLTRPWTEFVRNTSSAIDSSSRQIADVRSA